MEGTQREQIISTAIYYIDGENITIPTLEFRQRLEGNEAMDLEYEQDQHEHINRLYGNLNDGTSAAQTNSVELGHVLTSKQKCIVFPNTMQHKLSPFTLQDKNKPGHCRFIVMFLTHPNIRVPSTAEIKPQQFDERNLTSSFGLLKSEQLKEARFDNLPNELSEKIMKNLVDGPLENFNQIQILLQEKVNLETRQKQSQFQTKPLVDYDNLKTIKEEQPMTLSKHVGIAKDLWINEAILIPK